METIMLGDFVGGNATSMDSSSDSRDASHKDSIPLGDGELLESNEPEPLIRSRQDNYMLLGGGMTLLAGVLAIINGLRGLLTRSSFAVGPADTLFREAYCGILVLIFGIIAVAGGISGIRRKSFFLAAAGAILGMLGGGLFGFYLGLGALILFGLSDQDVTS